MDKRILISQTFECATVINEVNVAAKRVTVDAEGKVVKIEEGYFGEKPADSYVEPHFSVYTQQGKRKIRTDAELDINPCELVEQFISQIETY